MSGQRAGAERREAPYLCSPPAVEAGLLANYRVAKPAATAAGTPQPVSGSCNTQLGRHVCCTYRQSCASTLSTEATDGCAGPSVWDGGTAACHVATPNTLLQPHVARIRLAATAVAGGWSSTRV